MPTFAQVNWLNIYWLNGDDGSWREVVGEASTGPYHNNREDDILANDDDDDDDRDVDDLNYDLDDDDWWWRGEEKEGKIQASLIHSHGLCVDVHLTLSNYGFICPPMNIFSMCVSSRSVTP